MWFCQVSKWIPDFELSRVVGSGDILLCVTSERNENQKGPGLCP